MRKLLVCGLLLLLPIISLGCSKKADDSNEVKTSAPINNNAPEAATAGPAPVNPSIQYPGGSVKKRLPGG